MSNKNHYTAIGIFVTVLSILLVWIGIWLGAVSTDKKYDTYLIFVKEAVTGLSVKSPVRFNGVEVGFVKLIQIDQTNPQLVKLTIEIERGTPITAKTYATLVTQGITGLLYVNLNNSKVKVANLVKRADQTYPVIPSKPSLLTQVSDIAPLILKNVTEVSDSVSRMLSEQNAKAMTDILNSINTFTSALADSSENFKSSIAFLDKTLEQTSRAASGLPETMKDLQKVVRQTNSTMVDVRGLAKEARETVAKGSVMVETVTNQVLPSSQNLMQNLDALTVNLNLVSEQLNRNPSMLIRGKRPVAAGPGER